MGHKRLWIPGPVEVHPDILQACAVPMISHRGKDYQKIPVHEQVEVLSLVGDIALSKGEPQVHAHVVIGKADGTAHGGHLIEAHVRPTLEVILVEVPKHLQRQPDPETGLALIRL